MYTRLCPNSLWRHQLQKNFNRWQSVPNQDEDSAQMKHAAATYDARNALLLPVVGEKGRVGPETESIKGRVR